MGARSLCHTRVTHKDRIFGPFVHYVSLHEVLEADLIPECLDLWHEDDLGIVQHTNVPRNASDQRGHIDGAFAGDHLLPVSEHDSDWRAANLLRHGVQVLQLGQTTGLHEGARPW